MDYLDACAGVSETQWLDIFTGEAREQAEFWSLDQVVPGELRREGERLVRRWLAGEPPVTSLECWFRHVVCVLSRQDMAPVEPWVILFAMAHALAGRSAPSPREFAFKTNIPMASRTFARAVSIARRECPDGPDSGIQFLACNG